LDPGAAKNVALAPHMWVALAAQIPDILKDHKINLYDLVGKEGLVSLVTLVQPRLPAVKRGVRPGSWEYADVGGASAASTPSGGAGAAAPARSAGPVITREHGVPTGWGDPTAPAALAPANLAAAAAPATGTDWASHMGLGGGKKRRRKTKRRRTRRRTRR